MLVWLEFLLVEGAAEVKAAQAIEVGRRHVEELHQETCHLLFWDSY